MKIFSVRRHFWDVSKSYESEGEKIQKIPTKCNFIEHIFSITERKILATGHFFSKSDDESHSEFYYPEEEEQR